MINIINGCHVACDIVFSLIAICALLGWWSRRGEAGTSTAVSSLQPNKYFALLLTHVIMCALL
jgi:hypothetical protein